MDDLASHSPALRRLRTALAEVYGDRLDRDVLFGSRARGDFRSDFDYDVAVFLHHYTTRWAELGPLAKLTTEILIDTGAVISAKPFPAGACHDDHRPLMHEIARDGLERESYHDRHLLGIYIHGPWGATRDGGRIDRRSPLPAHR